MFENESSWTVGTENRKGIAILTIPYLYQNNYFFVTLDQAEIGGLVVVVQMLGSETECSSFGSEITVHRVDDPLMEGRHLHKLVGDVYSLELDKKERKKHGLTIGEKSLNRIVSVKGEARSFRITICLKKYA